MEDATYQRLSDAAESAFRSTSALFAYLFGSQAAGVDRSDSDIDIAVYVDPAIPDEKHLDLSLEFARALSEASGMGFIEVTILNRAPLPLLGRVIKERKVLYSRDEPSRVRFESRTLREFFDYEIHARPLDEKFLRDMAEGRR